MTGRVVSHFRVLDKLGAGGMGVVFEAEDLNLGRRVALKFLPENTATDRRSTERFEREARAASALNHPNICTVYEIGHSDSQAFIAMELLEGNTLSKRLESGSLPTKEVVRLAVQIADALDAAHSHDIIHRDIKPANIFVTTRGTAKVVDFGLAKSAPLPSPSAQIHDNSQTMTAVELTVPGLAVGTISYMSPEQAAGEPVDGRTDLFSLGVVLYEMSTGQRPFRGPSNVAILSSVLKDDPPPPSVLNPVLPPALDRIIKRLLEKDRERRYPTAAELQNELSQLLRDLESGTVPASPKSRFGLTTALVSIAILAVLFGVTLMRLTRSWTGAPASPPASQRSAPNRHSVAVLGFRNLTARPEVAWLSTAISEMISTEMAAGEAVRVIAGENVARSKVDLSIAEADAYSKETLGRIRKRLGSDLVVVGSYTDLGPAGGGQLRVDVRLQDAATGETIASVAETGTEANLFPMVTHAGTELRNRLGVGNVSSEDAGRVRASMPSSPALARSYAEGLRKLRLFDALGARDALEMVVAGKPDYAPGHYALSLAYSALGYDGKARAEAKQAFGLAASLSRENRLGIEGRYWEVERQWDKAIQAYRSLSHLFPDNVDYGLRLADVQISAGTPNEALETIAALRRIPAPGRDDGRIDLMEAQAHGSLGHFQQYLALAETADRKSEDAGFLRARAKAAEGWVLSRLGRLDEAQARLIEARSLYAASGYQQGVAGTLQHLATVFTERGDLAQARAAGEAALDIFRKIGDEGGTASALNDIANALYAGGDLPRARSVYEQSLATFRLVDSKGGIAGALGNIANILDAQGDLAAAKKMQEEGLEAFRAVGDERGASSTRGNLGNLLFELGELSESRRVQEEALAQRNKIGYKRGVAYSLESLGELDLAQGDLGAARQKFEQSMGIRREIGQRGTVAQSQLSLADLCIEEGNFGEARRLAQAAMDEFAREKEAENEALGAVMLARALMAQGQAASARSYIKRARAVMPHHASMPSLFTLDLADASLQPLDNGISKLRHVLHKAQQHGYIGYVLQSRLEQSELAVRAGKPARQELEALSREADARGFRLIAGKARKLMR